MSKPVNPSVGECECPIKGCTAVARVKHYKGNAEADRYIECPVHGVLRGQGVRFMHAFDAWIGQAMAGKPAPAPAVATAAADNQPAPEAAPERAGALAGMWGFK